MNSPARSLPSPIPTLLKGQKVLVASGIGRAVAHPLGGAGAKRRGELCGR